MTEMTKMTSTATAANWMVAQNILPLLSRRERLTVYSLDTRDLSSDDRLRRLRVKFGLTVWNNSDSRLLRRLHLVSKEMLLRRKLLDFDSTTKDSDTRPECILIVSVSITHYLDSIVFGISYLDLSINYSSILQVICLIVSKNVM